MVPESPDVSRDEVEWNIRTRGKTKLTSFPREHTLSALLYIFRLSLEQSYSKNKQTNKQRRHNFFIHKMTWARAEDHAIFNLVMHWSRDVVFGARTTTAQLYIWIWSAARDQKSTNHIARFVEWKSRYITIVNEHHTPWVLFSLRVDGRGMS